MSAGLRSALSLAVATLAVASCGPSRPPPRGAESRAASTAAGGWTDGTLIVQHKLANGHHVVSQIDGSGKVLRRFGELATDEFRSHLALSGGVLFRSACTYVKQVDQFAPDGSLAHSYTLGRSGTVCSISRDFAASSIFFVDETDSNNVVWHLDDPATGASTAFTATPGETMDLSFGGAPGAEHLLSVSAAPPPTPYTVSVIDATGAMENRTSPDFLPPYVFDIGRVAADPTSGRIYALSPDRVNGVPYRLVRWDASGASLPTLTLDGSAGHPTMRTDAAGHVFVGSNDDPVLHAYDGDGNTLGAFTVPDATGIDDVVVVGTWLPPPPGPVASCVGTAAAPQVIASSATTCGSTVDATNGLAGTCAPGPAGLSSCTFDGAGSETLGLGPHAVGVVATSADGTTQACTSYVTVKDTTPPAIDLTAMPVLTFPPPPSLPTLDLSPVVRDQCDPAPHLACDALGGAWPTTQPFTYGQLTLRFVTAAVPGGTYTLACTATDASANSATAQRTFTAPAQ